MASIYVDVELDEFDTEEIMHELTYRIRSLSRYNKNPLEDIKDEVRELSEVLNIKTFKGVTVETMEDQMKIEYFAKIFEKYTLTEIENKLP